MAESNPHMFLDAKLMNEIRERFLYVDQDPFSGRRVYLEASGGSLRLKSVVDTITKEASLPDELARFNPASDHVVESYTKGIEDVKLFLGAKSGIIMPSNSATQTIFRAVEAVTANIPGTNIVTTEIEHPAVLSSTQYFAEVTKKERRVARFSRETSSVPIEAIVNLVDAETCLLAIQHGSNQTGAINDVKAIIRAARKIKPDLYAIVDAVQYAPHGQIDVEDIGADAYAFGPYKAYCVKGIGYCHLSDRLAELPHAKFLDKPKTDWVLGSPAHMMSACWSTTVDYLCWLGGHFTASSDRRDQVVAAKEAIHGHMKALLHRALHGSAKVPGLLDIDHVTVCGMGDEAVERLCIFLFRLAGMDSSTAMHRYNREHGIRLAARIKDAYSTYPLNALGWPDAVRLSAAHYNTPEEIDQFLAATMALKAA